MTFKIRGNSELLRKEKNDSSHILFMTNFDRVLQNQVMEVFPVALRWNAVHVMSISRSPTIDIRALVLILFHYEDRIHCCPRIEGPLLQFTREDRTSSSSFCGGPVLQISIFASFVNLLDPPSHGIAYGCFPHVRQPPSVTLLAGKATVPAVWKGCVKKKREKWEDSELADAAVPASARLGRNPWLEFWAGSR
ncbi:Uncharacterized protein Adt_23365 [Abeliophyllum distichum]|uniref:Uncharacterized protein n=1 Tax=Abeliophyllum distichum TaxID=126358 RepID=A0ABD1SAN1_9LAMI